MNNLTTNESLRKRWNGDKKNKDYVNIYREQTSFCERLGYVCCSRPKPSRLHRLCKVVETYDDRFDIDDLQFSEPITSSTDRSLRFNMVNLEKPDITRQEIFNLVTNELSDVAILGEYGI